MFEDVWNEFCDKMKQDSLCDSDFADDMGVFLRSMLCGSGAVQRREKILASPYEIIFESDAKCCVLLHCPDDDYRFDFSVTKDEWRLQFIECITLPVHDIAVLPYADFRALPEKEAEIRGEKEITRLIYFYNQFKNLLGKQKAMEMFYDGAGEVLGARSWVPFFDVPRSYIAYAAWMENRIYGEHAELLEFDEKCCRLRFRGHLWRKIYRMAGHIEKMINYEEYMDIFESIWKNRASESGWTVRFIYDEEDTELVFTNSRRIILLNGPSSSGKSTLAKELQTCIKESRNEEYGIVSIDDFLVMDVHRNIYEEDVFSVSAQICAKLKEMLKSKQGVIVDHVITSERIFRRFMEETSEYAVILIHVTCPVQELMKRERERGNRCIGSAEASFEYLFPKDGYELSVDTFELSAKECAGKIIGEMSSGDWALS